MKTPIVDYVRQYNAGGTVRAHMPGHKGAAFLGFEEFDITEIKGADYLYFAEGIIAESEANATKLFKSGRTIYSTEGSSQCVKGMLYLALLNHKKKEDHRRPFVLAARNAHASFIHAAALLDLDVKWLWPENDDTESLCRCDVSAGGLEKILINCATAPAAVYVTCPDYLGNTLNLKELSEVCHKYGTLLCVDNAHGAYLSFLDNKKYPEYVHPMKCGADMCCDSAHKTLPVLTGGAYLHISDKMGSLMDEAKYAMALFGSTSPSYLILQSLDLNNRFLADGFEEKLSSFCNRMEELKKEISSNGWTVMKSDPMKLTIRTPEGITGNELANVLRNNGIECEYSDDEFVVMMLTMFNKEEDLEQIVGVLGKNDNPVKNETKESAKEGLIRPKSAMSIREAVFSLHEEIPVSEARGRICAAPTIACPPAISVAVPGERIDEELIKTFKKYHIDKVEVVKKSEKENVHRAVKLLC